MSKRETVKCTDWRDLYEWTWDIITNIGTNLGEWKLKSNERQEIASKWRDEYHGLLKVQDSTITIDEK